MEFLLTVILSILRKKPRTENFRHAKRYWKKHAPAHSFSRTVLILTLLFLYIPLLVIIIFSFNKSEGAHFTGVSFRWYEELFLHSEDLWMSLLYSAIVAVVSAIIATILGSLAAIGISWYKFFGKGYIQSVSFLPMILPEVIMGVSLLIFLSGIHMNLGLGTIIIAHTTFCLPFVYLMVSSRVDEFDYSIIEASHDLGATEKQTLFKVIIPAIIHVASKSQALLVWRAISEDTINIPLPIIDPATIEIASDKFNVLSSFAILMVFYHGQYLGTK